MTPDHHEQIEQLLRQAFSSAVPSEEIAHLEEAIRIADAHRDEESGFGLRKALIHSATFGGAPEKVVPAYSWCLALCDRDPENFAENEMLWQSKWVLDMIPEFPGVSKAQIISAIDEMAKRYERSGAGMRSVRKLLCTAAIDFADRESARAAFAQWQACERDWTSDCEACDMDTVVQYHAFMGDDDKALSSAQPILAGKKHCAEVPHLTYGRVLMPMARQGRISEAMAIHRKGYPMAARNREMLTTASRHLEFLAHTENRAKGLELFRRHLPWALECKAGLRAFEFWTASLFLFESLKAAGKTTRKLQLPAAFPLHDPEGVYNVADIAAWLDAESRKLAEQIDQRNGNSEARARIDRIPRMIAEAQPFPIASSVS